MCAYNSGQTEDFIVPDGLDRRERKADFGTPIQHSKHIQRGSRHMEGTTGTFSNHSFREPNTLEKEVWEEWLNVRIASRYYGILTYKFERFNLWFTVFLVFSLSTALWAVLNSFHELLASGLLLVITLATIWAHFSNWQRKSTFCSVVYDQCNRLELDWNQLRLELDAQEQPLEGHFRRHQILSKKFHETTAKVPEYGILDEKLHHKCSEEVYEIVKHEQA